MLPPSHKASEGRQGDPAPNYASWLLGAGLCGAGNDSEKADFRASAGIAVDVER